MLGQNIDEMVRFALTESSPCHLFINPSMINQFIFGHRVVIYSISTKEYPSSLRYKLLKVNIGILLMNYDKRLLYK